MILKNVLILPCFNPGCVKHGALVAFVETRRRFSCNGPGSTWGMLAGVLAGVLGCAQCAPPQLRSTKDSTAPLKLHWSSTEAPNRFTSDSFLYRYIMIYIYIIYTRIFQCIFLSHHFITSHHFVFLALIPRIPRCEEARRVVISDLWDPCAECWSHFAACWTWNFWICFGCQSLKVEASQDLEFQSPSTCSHLFPSVPICSHLFPSVPICSLCCDVWDLVPGVCVRSSTVRICAFSSKLQGGGQLPQRDSSRLPRLPGFKFWLGLQTGTE